MITPLGGVSLERVIEEYPEDAVAVYRIILDNTVAHLKSAPEVREERMVFAAGSRHVAVGWVTPLQRGWIGSVPNNDTCHSPLLPIGSDMPLPSLPLEDCSFRVVQGQDSRRDLPAVDALLQWLDTLLVASPGRIAELLEESVDAGWLSVQEGSVYVTSEGQMELKAADTTGYSRVNGMTTALWRTCCDEYIVGELSLQELVDTSRELWGIQTPVSVNALETLVADGHSSADAYALRDRMVLKRAATDEYPPNMNPQFLLSQEDPLRADRENLEMRLSTGYEQVWSSLSARERAAIRMGALAESMHQDDLEGWVENVRFDVRWRWMVGLSMDDRIPDLATAVGSYHAWRGRGGPAK